MQNANDTFYEVLRDRVAAANAGLTVVVRGAVRPAVLVEANELPQPAERRDCFRLSWTAVAVDNDGPLPLAKMRCAIRYATAGAAGGGGLDRGRALASLDAVLSSVVGAAPQSAVKKNFAALASGGEAVAMVSKIWWSDVSFAPAEELGDVLRRVAMVDVWSYEEPGEGVGRLSETGVEAVAPVVRRVRAYFAPVNRATGQASLFDAAQTGRMDVNAPPAPWVDLGWVRGFTRSSATKIEPVLTGAPATTQLQVRTEIGATLGFTFESWGKLQIALAAGTQQMNLLQTAAGAAAAGSGGTAVAAVGLLPGSTATVLQMGAAAFTVGDLLAVDVDYAGETGYVGSGVSGAYTRVVLTDVDYVRRVTLNVGRVASVAGGAVTLESPLLAGVPVSGMKASVVQGFCDREGSSFFQEWSGLFVLEGQQGDRVLLHYPRLQTMVGAGEQATFADGLETVRLAAGFRALPVRDGVDGEQVVCFRSYLPA